MKNSELRDIFAAILILAAIIGFGFVLKSGWTALPKAILFAFIIIAVNIASKKTMAYLLDSDVEHEIWKFSRFGIKPHHHFNKELPGGIIFPLFFSLFSLGQLKFMAILSYESRALKHRAAKRFGYYSYTEMTEWHNGLIGASGIIAMFLISIISYLYGAESLAKMATFYALSNIIPISKLDGTQIFFGSRILWSVLAAIVLIFTAYAFYL